MSFKLSVLEFYADNCRQALPYIVSLEIGVVILEHTMLAGIIVQNAVDGILKSRFMGTAVHRVNIVGKGNNALIITFVILQSHLRNGVPVGGRDMNHLGMQHLISPGPVHKLHEGGDSPLITIYLFHFMFRITPVGEGDL